MIFWPMMLMLLLGIAVGVWIADPIIRKWFIATVCTEDEKKKELEVVKNDETKDDN